MCRTHVVAASCLLSRRRWPLLAVLTMMLGLLSAPVQAGIITLRFDGTVDLSEFGASSTSLFAGSVSWDPNTGWVPVDPGCPDFCLDGSPGAVSATFAINSIDYTQSIDPISRLIVWGFGGISLDLIFAPPLDFDGGAAPDVLFFSLDLFSEPPDFSILVDSQLPDDLLFLPHLNDRSALFSETIAGTSICQEFMGACASADTLSVVPEPASTTLLLVGLCTAAVSARRRRAYANRARRPE